MFKINAAIAIPDDEIDMQAVRAQGAGGQNVNKVASAIHLRLDIRASSLPEHCKQRLLQWPDQRISEEGVIIIKAQRFRSQERNRQDALQRLGELIRAAIAIPKKRTPTRRTLASKKRRLEEKSKRGNIKALRGKPHHHD